MAKGIKDFMTRIANRGGMSLTTGFDVEFSFPNAGEGYFSGGPYYTGEDKTLVTLLCDEAQLPNVQSGVAQVSGRFLGEGPIYYPHTRIYTDFSLGFLLDGNLTALKFFNDWYEYIFKDETTGHTLSGADAQPRPTNRVNRLRFPETYTCTAKVRKTEPDKNSYEGRVPAIYMLENCYPYSIDAVPLAYGSSQVTRLTVNFYYTRHTVSYSQASGPGFYRSNPIGDGMNPV